MRTKVTLFLLLLNAALFVFIFRFERDWRTEGAALEVRRRVLGAEAADIRTLEVANAAGASFRLERRGDTWFIVRPLEWPANQRAVSAMINDLQLLEHLTSFRVADLAKNGQSLDDYGLSRPRITLTFTSGGDATGGAATTTVLRLGDATQVGNRLYLLSPDGSRVHVIEREKMDDFTVPLEKIRSDAIMGIPVFEARALTLQSGGAAGVRVGIRRDGGRWSFETPILARANKERVETAINGLDSLRVKAFVANPPGPPPSAAPSLQARVEGNNRSETLLVGEPVARPGDDYYAQFKERDALRPAVFVVTIPPPLMAPLREAQDQLRERRILDFDPSAVTAVTLAAPNQPDLTLRRLEAPGAADGAGWEVVRLGEGAPGAQATPADRAAVQRLLDNLAQLSAETFQSDAPQAAQIENWGFNRPERSVTLAWNGGQATLEIGLPGQPDGLAYARLTAFPSSIYAVKADVLAQTPTAPRDWRERRLRELPADAVRSLSLDDLATGRPVYRRALAAGETWEQAWRSEPEARRRALEGLLEGVRALRARRFVLDSFGEQVSAGGESRSWRYRLDAGLAGSAGGARASSLWLTERIGGTQQFAGSPEFGAVFEIDQGLADALWSLTYGSRDPGAPAAAPDTKP